MPAATETSRPAEGSLLWGHHPEFLSDPIGFLTRCAREHGDAVPLRFGPVRFWVLSDPARIGEVLTTRAGAFRKDRGLLRTRVLLGNGLLTSEGEEHDRKSRLAQPSFRARAVETYAQAMVEVAEEVAGSWPDGGAIRLSPELSRLTLSVVARALFGAELLERSSKIEAAITELMPLLDERIHGLWPLPLCIPTRHNRRFVQSRAVLEEAVDEMIREKRLRGPSDDLLSRLLTARDDFETGLTDRELRDEVMTLFLAGHETTANALGFTLWLLAAHPEKERRVREEVDAVLGERRAQAADAPRLVFTAAAVHEAMRLYPPAWLLGRQAAEEVDLGGMRLRRGDMVGMSPFVVQRDPRWFEEPLAFCPERFLPEAPKPAPFTYFPFGGGKRACIGRSFALLEATLVLSTIVQRVELSMDTRAELSLEPHLTLRPAGGLPAVVHQRSVLISKSSSDQKQTEETS
jgi:cytochrome P450